MSNTKRWKGLGAAAALVIVACAPSRVVARGALDLALVCSVVVAARLVHHAGTRAIDRHFDRSELGITVAEWLVAHSYASESVGQLSERITGRTIAEIEEERWWHRAGWDAAQRDATRRRSEAARMAHARRRVERPHDEEPF